MWVTYFPHLLAELSIVSPVRQAVIKGAVVLLTCSTTKKAIWTLNDKEVPHNTREAKYQNYHYLIINNTNFYNEGRYQCFYKWGNTKMNQSCFLTVIG